MIRLNAVEKRYGTFQALYPLDLHVKRGEVFGFLGPNGAGKTTTIRTLSGVLTPTSGSVLIDGVDIIKEPVESKKKVGWQTDGLPGTDLLQLGDRLWGSVNDKNACTLKEQLGWQTDEMHGAD